MTIISFEEFKNKQGIEEPKANVTQNILDSFNNTYQENLTFYNINIEDPSIAFDIATIYYLMRGMAHRSQGESHPSQIILDSLKSHIAG